MNRDDVLLTETEYSDAYMKAVQGKLNTASILRITEGHDAQKNAQCLKLLDVLNQDCSHGFSVIKCYECMSEIEKLLKEG